MKWLLLSMSLLFATIEASAQSLETELDLIMSRYFPAHSPGGALLVRLKGKTVYQKGFGLAELPTGKRVSPETNFRMASVSKQFTAMAVMLLEKQNKLSIDDPLLRFFPEFNRVVGEKVTVRHLLTHTSGLIDYETILPVNQTKQISDADVLRLVSKLDSTYFEPGAAFRYSNTGFCLLEQLVERVARQPYVAFLKQSVFDPLGMENTRLYDGQSLIPNRAMGYALDSLDKPRLADQSITSATKGDGCIYTSLKDYQKWLDALEKGRLINLPAAMERIAYPLDEVPNGYYGLGWFQYRPQEGETEYFHSGSTSGFSLFVVRVPQTKTVVVLFSNLAENTEPFEEIMDAIDEHADNAPLIDIWGLHDLTR